MQPSLKALSLFYPVSIEDKSIHYKLYDLYCKKVYVIQLPVARNNPTNVVEYINNILKNNGFESFFPFGQCMKNSYIICTYNIVLLIYGYIHIHIPPWVKSSYAVYLVEYYQIG